MEEWFEDLIILLEKTSVEVIFDRNITLYLNEDKQDIEAGIIPNEEYKYFFYNVEVDGFSKLIEYSKRLDFLIQKLTKNIEDHINDKVYYSDVKTKLEKIKSTVLPIYSNPSLTSFSEQSSRHQRRLEPLTSYYFEPNINIEYKKGNSLDSDWREFEKIKLFVDKKLYFARMLTSIVTSKLELLKEARAGRKFETFKFKEDSLINSRRFNDFHKNLIDHGLIDKIDLRLFTKCFSGKETGEKINWKDTKVALAYFVRTLSKLIVNENKWVALSDSFLFQGQIIVPNVFSTIKKEALPNKETRGFIDEIIKNIEPISHS